MGNLSMSDLDQPLRHSIVELAMARASSHKARSSGIPSPEADMPEHTAGLPGNDDALPHRKRPKHSVLEAGQPTSSEAPPKSGQDPVIARRTAPSHFPRIASHFISAATGAVVMWSIMSESGRTPISTPPAAAVMAATTPAVLETRPITPPTAVPTDTQVRDMLERWRQSWSSRDIDAYLGFYSTNFVPADGTKRSVWAEGRRKNFLSRSSISVGIHEVTVAPVDSHQVKVMLLQDYASGSYTETRRPKNFLLAQEGNDWRIIKEWQGRHSPPPTFQE
jgi:hypothetical protein